MARYVAVDDIKARVPADILARLTDDRPDANPPEIQDAQIENAIKFAESYFDSGISKKYRVPLTLTALPQAAQDLIHEACIDFTVFRLYARVNQSEKEQHKKDMMDRVIEGINKGTIELPGAESISAAKADVDFSAPDAVFAKSTRHKGKADL